MAIVSGQEWTTYLIQVQEALYETDNVAIRCFKAGIPFPSAWQTYTLALRALYVQTSGDNTLPLPTKPAYPAGT